MPDIKNLQLKNIEKEKSAAEGETSTSRLPEQAVPAPEKEPKIKISPADKEIVLDEIAQAEKEAEASGPALAGLGAVQQKYRLREKQIGKIMEHGLTDLYIRMPADKQREFKLAGEQTARKISSLLNQTKVRIKKIISLIRKWLLIIPGINKFFLEQEAKIKADEVMRLQDSKS